MSRLYVSYSREPPAAPTTIRAYSDYNWAKKRTGVVQQAPLLKLPPELRNIIYTYAAQNEDTLRVEVKDQGAYPSPKVAWPLLSKVCRQIRSEYTGIFRTEVLCHAPRLEFTVQNFDVPTVQKVLEGLPAPAIGVIRSYSIHLKVDNFAYHHYKNVDTFMSGLWLPVGIVDDDGEEEQAKCDVRVSYDPRSLDIGYFETGKLVTRHRSHEMWPQFVSALEAARERYEEQKNAKKRGREDGGGVQRKKSRRGH